MSKPSETVYCPICKSENISDISTYQNNGIYGKGSKQWKVNDLYCCNDCIYGKGSKQWKVNDLRLFYCNDCGAVFKIISK